MAEPPRPDQNPTVVESRSASLPVGQPTAEPSAGHGPAPVPPRYQPVRFHARGGLGEVHVAEDQELHRPVALKRMQARHAGDPEYRRRFLLEAEVTGRLEHPGVVPVYGLLHDAHGGPCYAMRFIEGETLQAALDRFHTPPAPGLKSPGCDSSPFRQLLQRFVTVCNTVAYAHSRGILHRDLKPTNIMLGKFGETLVVDWGLAKQFTRTEREPAPGEATPAPATGAAGSTELGRALGTPAYMSPEQAAGRWNQVGPASDVYGLGATLYTLLTNRPPFQETTLAQLLDRVTRGDFRPPRRVNPAVPAALDAICRKAMAREPVDRYATALDLAADLEHWLAQEPVSAWREPWTVRTRRWCGRHRSLVTGIAAAVCVGLLVLAGATALLTTAWERERQARQAAEGNADEARRQQERADRGFRKARDAVDRYFVQVSDSRLLNEPGLQPLRKELLETALTFYEEFVQERRNDPAARADLAWAYFRLAVLTKAIGSRPQAVAYYEQALPILAELAGAHPDRPEYANDQAKCHSNLANLYLDLGRNAAAETAYQEACRIREGLTRDYPDVAEYAGDLARTYSNLGVLYHRTRRLAPAEAAYQKALQIREAWVKKYPESAEWASDLAFSLYNLGELYSILGRTEEAAAAYRRALVLQEKLVREHGTVQRYQSKLAATHDCLGSLYQTLGQTANSEAAYRQALTLREKLAGANAQVTAYQDDLADSWNNLGDLYRATRRTTEAETHYRRSLALREDLARRHPTVPDYQYKLGKSHANLALWYAARYRSAQAEAAYLQAQTILSQLVQDHPGVPEYRALLAKITLNFGVHYRDAGQLTEAESAYEQAREQFARLAKEHPQVPDYQSFLGICLNNLGVLCANTGRPEKAFDLHQEALVLREDLARSHPRVLQYAVNLGATFIGLGNCRADRDERDAARACYAQAITMLTAVLKQGPRHVEARELLRNAHWRRARALTRWGDFSTARPDWERAVELAEGPGGAKIRVEYARTLALRQDHAAAAAEAAKVADSRSPPTPALVDLAGVYALCMIAARQDGSQSPADRERLAESYAARAVALLSQAHDAGHFQTAAEVERLQTDEDLAPLRSRPDFQKLLAALKPKGPSE
jgi:serine/threonine-protein kinase